MLDHMKKLSDSKLSLSDHVSQKARQPEVKRETLKNKLVLSLSSKYTRQLLHKDNQRLGSP